MRRPTIRFAPSPNGELHLGHALSALLAWRAARRLGARFLLRIEDIDLARCRPDYEAGIERDLAWLGLDWERPVRRQSEHFADYAAALGKLDAMGLVYPCAATRPEIAEAVALAESAGGPWPRDPDGAPLYPGLYRGRREEAERAAVNGSGLALRLDMRAARERAGELSWRESGEDGLERKVAARPQAWGDVVLRRKDVPTSYHLAVVVDDAAQGVTHIVRGRDLYEATSVHRLLQALLGLPEPAYAHHQLILGPDGEKLAKSRRDTSLAALRQAGASPADICRMIGL